MVLSIIKEKIKKLPQGPGVYFYRDQKSKIIYIGKATNLKSRVQSYFRDASGANRPIEMMIGEVADIDFVQTDSVLEALILESNLIKKYQPKYNVLGKDDKSFSYFAITKEEFPRVLIMRKTDIDNDKIQISNGKSISKSKVQKIRNTKYDIRYTSIFGPYTSKHQMEIALKIIRKIFPFHSNKQNTEKGCLDFQIRLCPGPYAGGISKNDYAKNIRGIKMILEGKKQSLLKKMEKEMKDYAKKHKFEKAAETRNKIFALQHIRDIALISKDFNGKSSVISHRSSALRVEAYDISNISGMNAVGSMVVFENGKPNKSEYRKFKIKTVEGSNDVGMMREVLLRRFKNDWAMPDLILLDGGAGHLNMAEELLHEELGLDVHPVKSAKGGAKQFNRINIAAVAKGPTRKNLELRISNAEKIAKEIKNILNNKLLLKQIMDEAHRFAITYHRKLRRKSALE